MHTPRSLTLFEVNIVPNARMKVHINVKESTCEWVCAKQQKCLDKGTSIFINPDSSMEE